MDINYYKQFEPIDGKWYITKELGRGAFGTVFEIERRDFTNAKSALKIISIPYSIGEVQSYREENFELDEKSITSYFYGFVEEFVKEFEVMLKLKGSSNIVGIEDYDVKKHNGEIGWDIFIRMELLTPMNKYFSNKSLTQTEVIKLGIDICKALEVCQKHNIIHRDIKPSNIFVSKNGEFKLGDFGVARTLEKTSSGLSKKGTYTYMAPEVFKGDTYGTNVDIYSLGIVMYKLLNNNFEPFRTVKNYADEEKSLITRMNGESIPKPANAEGRLAEIVLKACSYNPKDRYESPKQMREELERIVCNEVENVCSECDAGDYDVPADEKKGNETVGIFGDFIKQEENKTASVFGKNNTEQFDIQKENDSVEDMNLKLSNLLIDVQSNKENAAETSFINKSNIVSFICSCALIILCVIMPMGYSYPDGIDIRYFINMHEQTNTSYFILLRINQPITSIMSLLNLICSGAIFGCFVFEKIKKQKVDNLILNVFIYCQIVFVLVYSTAMSVHFTCHSIDKIFADIVLYGLEVLLFISLNIVIFKINKVNNLSIDNNINDKSAISKKKRNFGIICMSAVLAVNLVCGITLNIMSAPGAIRQFMYVYTLDDPANPQIPTAIISLIIFAITSLDLVVLIKYRNQEKNNDRIELFIKISSYACVILIVLSFIVYGINLKQNCDKWPSVIGIFTWSRIFETLYINFVYIAILLIYIVTGEFMKNNRN